MAKLIFPPECKRTTQELIAMISAVLDEPAARLHDSPEIPHRMQYGWQHSPNPWWPQDEHSVKLFTEETGGRVLFVAWGRLSEVYQPALSWGAIEAPAP